MLTCEEIEDRGTWSQIAEELSAHPLQTWGWGELKGATGPWEARRVALSEEGRLVGGAQVLVRRLPAPFGRLAYVPRGPFVADGRRLGEAADAVATWAADAVRPVCLKIEPAVPTFEATGGWREGEYVLLAKTTTVDLRPDEDAIMASLHSKKARQYIRKAGRGGVTCREATADDLDAVLVLYHGTAAADGFGIHEDDYYRRAFELLGDVSQLFVAEQEGEAQAFLWNVTTTDCAFELWGAVDDAGKRSRANYLLKWHAMVAAKERGAALYDLNGLLNDNISKFKLLFGGEPTWWAGTFDKPLSPLYPLFSASLGLRKRLRG